MRAPDTTLAPDEADRESPSLSAGPAYRPKHKPSSLAEQFGGMHQMRQRDINTSFKMASAANAAKLIKEGELQPAIQRFFPVVQGFDT